MWPLLSAAFAEIFFCNDEIVIQGEPGDSLFMWLQHVIQTHNARGYCSLCSQKSVLVLLSCQDFHWFRGSASEPTCDP